MAERETMPINHSTGSHVLHTGGGAVSGGAKGLFAGLGVWAIAPIVLGVAAGALVSLIPGVPLLGAVLWGAGIGSIPAALVGFGALLTGVVAAPVVGLVGGAVKGGHDAHQQVQRDRAAAHMVDAEVGAMQAQAIAMQAQAQALTHGNRPGDRYAGASTMLQADANMINAAQGTSQGMINAAQLQTART